MKTQNFILFLLLIYFVLFAGCENSVDSIEKGICKVNVTGYVTKSYSGEAIFENVTGPISGKVFFLVLRDISLPDGQYRFVQFSGSQPEIGTYNLINIEDSSTEGRYIGSYNDSEMYGYYKSIGGEIGITYASNTEIKGWFNFLAYENISKDNGEFERAEINISGEFYAEEGYIGINLE